jgi:ABC-type sugar transport system permease subunit
MAGNADTGSAVPALASEVARAGHRARPYRRMAAAAAPYLYVAPMVVLVGIFLLYPAADTIWLSFTNWNGIGAPAFTGLDNYVKLGTDPAFITACLNTVYWVAGLIVFQVVLGLALAVLLDASPLAELYKRILYLPAAISGAAIGVIWYAVFNNQEGILNTALRFVSLSGLAQPWLTTPPLNTFAMVVAAVWQGLGPTVILFLVGLRNIPRDPLEAARVDGASAWRLFRHVTLPLLRPMTVVVVGINLINSFKVFDIIWTMTQGGPYRSSETLAVTMYRDSFVSFQFGYGASVAMVLTVIVFAVAVFYIRSMFQRLEVS